MQEEDACPTTWNPNNDPAICESLPAGFSSTRPTLLTEPDSDPGASTWHRTHEPVEIPLWNGIIDDSVIGYWKLGGGEAGDSGLHGNYGTPMDLEATQGVFGEQDGAGLFNGITSQVVLADAAGLNNGGALTSFSLSLWFEVPEGSQNATV